MNTTQQEIVTLASIVEAESSIGDERPIIAGVYWNRIKKRCGSKLIRQCNMRWARGKE